MPDIDIGGATLHYATSGAGEPILLIPGLGLDHSYYRFGMPLLARHLQVLAVDPRGIRRGVQEMTRFGMGEAEMARIAELIHDCLVQGKNVEDECRRLRAAHAEIRFGYGHDQVGLARS